ncbi:MAG: hypothetical protein COV91_02660 [Candidatus Taylorbacteria bacterium CG11_big_fil_rev_8_21_14_0_20_46_11]|uniref:Phage shock protein PspC N-terminal domain-containing protein n=1 Tax=Candidatus Taylorbacteria bacterium CG11_big_fil_rev_8_21_14_0_20_46_11 TaxID=1975025 RepID=A0A2H0KBT8_9BACT|nr:MAG: hypothetical protein COV91_02660 [Candidatus Taylorbacteria bacterium CG11_big_fil_rev_8_21_14_0_20_46_11]
MKKTLTVNLGGVIYNIEEDAYQRLDEYLGTIRTHFATSGEKESGDEIVGDIEGRATETFANKKIINSNDVESFITSMGTIDDIAGAHTPTDSTAFSRPSAPKGEKRLFRDTENAMVSGVCSGIAAYFGIDPTIVRLVFALSLLFGGAGIIVYIILVLVVPEAKSLSEKLEMKGESVTLSGLTEKVTSRVAHLNKSRFQSGVRAFSQSVVHMLKKIAPLILGIVGVVLIVAGAIAIAGVVVSAVAVFSGAHTAFLDFPIREYLSGGYLALVLVSVVVVVVFPLSLLISLGATLMRGKSSFSLPRLISSFTIWIIALSMLTFTAIQISPVFEGRMRHENQKTVTRTYDLKDFTRIKTSGTVAVTLTQGDVYSITAVESENDVAGRISLTQTGDVLKIKNATNRGLCLFCFFEGKSPSVTVTMPELQYVQSTGASHTDILGFSGDALDIVTDGASRLIFEGHVNTLSISADGASSATLSGSADALTAKLDGASRLTASDLATQTVSVDLDGASSAWVSASTTLDVIGDGISSLLYFGHPNITQKMHGMSRIEAFDTAPSTITPSDTE